MMRLFTLSSLLLCAAITYADATSSSPTASASTANWKIYQNPTYGFQIAYPQQDKLHHNFDAGSLYSNAWAYNLTGAGMPVVRIVAFNGKFKSVVSGQTYKDTFLAELRIGVGTDEVALKNCIPQPAGKTVSINDQTFYLVPGSDAGMMHALNVLSYRTVYNNKCYVLDQIEAYSQTGGQPGQNLTATYTGLADVVNTFKFSNS